MAKYGEAWVNEATGEIFTPRGRLVYTDSIVEAKINRNFPAGETNRPRHTTILLIPKAANIKVLTGAVAEKAKEIFGADWQKKKSIKFCIAKTADNEKLAQYAEDFPYLLKVAANAGFPPFIYGPNAQRFAGDASEIYSGRWAVIAGGVWGSKKGDGNVSFNFNRIQLLEHDEPIAGGRVATSDGFEQVNVGSGSADDVFGGEVPKSTGKAADPSDEIPF